MEKYIIKRSAKTHFIFVRNFVFHVFDHLLFFILFIYYKCKKKLTDYKISNHVFEHKFLFYNNFDSTKFPVIGLYIYLL